MEFPKQKISPRDHVADPRRLHRALLESGYIIPFVGRSSEESSSSIPSADGAKGPDLMPLPDPPAPAWIATRGGSPLPEYVGTPYEPMPVSLPSPRSVSLFESSTPPGPYEGPLVLRASDHYVRFPVHPKARPALRPRPAPENAYAIAVFFMHSPSDSESPPAAPPNPIRLRPSRVKRIREEDDVEAGPPLPASRSENALSPLRRTASPLSWKACHYLRRSSSGSCCAQEARHSAHGPMASTSPRRTTSSSIPIASPGADISSSPSFVSVGSPVLPFFPTRRASNEGSSFVQI